MTEKPFAIKLIKNLQESDECFQTETFQDNQSNNPLTNQNYILPYEQQSSNFKISETEEENNQYITPKISIQKGLFIRTPKINKKNPYYYNNNNQSSPPDSFFFEDPQQVSYRKIQETACVAPFELYSNNHSICSQDFSPEIICEENSNNQLKRCCSYLDEAANMQSPLVSPTINNNGRQFPFMQVPTIVTRSNSSIEMQFSNTFLGQQKYSNNDLGNNKFLHNQPIEEREQEDQNYEQDDSVSDCQMQMETVKKDINNEIGNGEQTPPCENSNRKQQEQTNIFSTPVKKKNNQNNLQSNKTIKKHNNLISSVESNKVKLTKEENKILKNEYLKTNFKILQVFLTTLKSKFSNRKLGLAYQIQKYLKYKVKLMELYMDQNQFPLNVKFYFSSFANKNKKDNPVLKIQMQQKLHNCMNTNCIKNNPNIIKYYQTWELDDKHIGWTMEHCKSNLLQLQNSKKRFSEVEIRTIIRDICLGLDLMHSEKLYHLNLKPENILLSKMNKYKISDIGLALYSFNISDTFQFIQSYDQRYLSLEFIQYLKFNKTNQFESNSSINFVKVDIYALGAIIYQLCIGSTLPNAGEEWNQLRSNQFKKLDQIPIYSNSLKEMIKQMMNKNPVRRFTAKQVLECLPNELELELQWHKKRNALLKKKAKVLELQLIEKGLLKREKGNKNKSFC